MTNTEQRSRVGLGQKLSYMGRWVPRYLWQRPPVRDSAPNGASEAVLKG